MKKIYSLPLISLAVALFSCNERPSDQPIVPDVNQLSILTTVLPSENGAGELVGPSNQFKANAVATRINVTNNVFENDDNIGLYVVEWEVSGGTQTLPALESAGNITDNHRYIYKSAAGASWAANTWVAQTLPNPLTWRKVSVYGYHPYSATLADALTVPVNVREDQRSGVVSSDYFMVCEGKKNATGYSPTTDATPIDLQFKHLMAHVAVSVTLPASYNGVEIKSIDAAQILGVPVTGNFANLANYSSPLTVSTNASDMKPVMMEKKAGGTQLTGEFFAVVSPFTVVAGREIVKIDYTTVASTAGSLYMYAGSTGFTFEQNKRYTLTLTTEEFGFEKDLTEFAAAGGVQMVTVKSTGSATWTVTSGDDSWISFPGQTDVKKVTGTGSVEFKVETAANTTGQSRMSYIVLSRTDKLYDVELTVFQKAN